MKINEFELEKKLIELKKKAELEIEEVKHKNHLEEIAKEREVKMELQRIKSAEIKRSIDRQQNKRFVESY